ncbi:hypothetical protein [Burkholderia sp. TSV86]|uniref:hypothetical protein n=1 Tax=Burkholderia sp. TSV86 TaxID=1385594 RepID=UPI000AF943B3|nr:hypothetical protein [Burkholderia sp. TSV86]
MLHQQQKSTMIRYRVTYIHDMSHLFKAATSAICEMDWSIRLRNICASQRGRTAAIRRTLARGSTSKVVSLSGVLALRFFEHDTYDREATGEQ